MNSYKACNGCSYYQKESDRCLYGKPDIPLNWSQKCDENDYEDGSENNV